MTPKKPFAEEIKFTARAGFLSKRLWLEFFATGGDRWMRKQWWLMKDRGYFQTFGFVQEQEVLVLNPRNRHVQTLTSGFRETPPSPLEVRHDETLLFGLLTLKRVGIAKRYVLEKQLMREQESKLLADRSDKFKFPDAIIYLNSGKLVAIEMELSRKSMKRYIDILKRSSSIKDIQEILYVCDDVSIERVIQRAARFAKVQKPLRFAPVDVWTRSPERLFGHKET